MRYLLSILLFAISLSLTAQSSLLTGLSAYWKFDETSGSYAVSEVNNATINSVYADGTTINQTGKLGKCAVYTIGTDCVSGLSVDVLRMSSSDCAMSAWVYPTTLTNADGGSFLTIVGAETGGALFFVEANTGLLRLNARNVTTAPASDFVVNINTWHHVGFSYDQTADELTYFMDGQYDTVSFSHIFTESASSSVIGQTISGSSTTDFVGSIDEVGVWKKKLTLTEISTLYNAGIGVTYPFSGVYNPTQFEPSTSQVSRARPTYNGMTKYMTYSVAQYIIPIISFSGYDSTYTLACKQKYAIPENVDNSDVVGAWLKTWTWMSTGTISYSIETDPLSAFAINSSTGIITISDATKINGKIVTQDTTINLLIRTTDSQLGYEIDTAVIRVKENAYCVFFDYAYTGTETGTRTQPRNDLDDVTITPGYGYFLKRGNVAYGEGTLIKTHLASAAHPTLFSSYGVGDNFVFDGTGASGHCFFFGENGDGDRELDRADYVELYNLEIFDYTYIAIEVYRKSRNLGFYNIYMHNNDKNSVQSNFVINTQSYADSTTSMPVELLNCEFDTVGYLTDFEPSLIKCGTSPFYVINCRFGISIQDALRITSGSLGVLVKHCYFNMGYEQTAEGYNNIQIRGHNTTVEDCRFIGAGCGVYITAAAGVYYQQPDYVTVKNCYFKNQGNTAIWMRPPSNTYNVSVDHVYENNYILTKGRGINYRDANNLTIRRNVIIGLTTPSTLEGIINSEADVNSNIYYNVLSNFTYGIYSQVGSGLEIYNNTIMNPVYLTGSSSQTVRNNFYKSITTPAIQSNNIDIDDIVMSDYFVNYASNNFTLKGTALYAIDLGYDVSLTPDIIGVTVPKGLATDIGAYEYNP
jgi:hypothetical protein